mmetsp:Transcript_219/g.992  ORF Transcript_219/g.992 Transcript_219/m.992 type:complete len:195 (-) Transcript_219:242-826(-)
MGCRIYRGWPVCETEDVLRILAAGGEEDVAELSEVKAWERYRAWFSDWPRERAMAYIDFHCRHVTLGEIGAALSHWHLIQEACLDGVDWMVVFEDDARPFPEALPRLQEEIALLARHGFDWDASGKKHACRNNSGFNLHSGLGVLEGPRGAIGRGARQQFILGTASQGDGCLLLEPAGVGAHRRERLLRQPHRV